MPTPTTLRPERKRIRLPAPAYLVPGSAWLVTVGTMERSPVFSDHDLATAVCELLRDRCRALGALLDAYCLMSDHAHLVVQITDAGPIDIVRDIKSRSTRLWWQHGGSGSIWQRSFHDHGLRTANDWDRAVAYVLNNPVRAGLVADWADNPFVGGSSIADPDDQPSPPPSSS